MKDFLVLLLGSSATVCGTVLMTKNVIPMNLMNGGLMTGLIICTFLTGAFFGSEPKEKE